MPGPHASRFMYNATYFWNDGSAGETMSTKTTTWTEETVEVGQAQVQLVKGGTGEPLLILHDEMGHHDWLQYHEALAQRHTLLIPSHPGFGKSERLDWVMNMRDYAGWYLDALDDLGLEQVSVIGFSFGGLGDPPSERRFIRGLVDQLVPFQARQDLVGRRGEAKQLVDLPGRAAGVVAGNLEDQGCLRAMRGRSCLGVRSQFRLSVLKTKRGQPLHSPSGWTLG